LLEPSTGLPLDPNVTEDPPGNIMVLDDIKVTLLGSYASTLLQEEMKKLGSSVRSVQKGLDIRISSSTGTFLMFHLQAPSIQRADLKARLLTFYEEYLEIVWESRRIAGNARTAAKDFAGDFIDMIRNKAHSYEVKKKEIAEYRKLLEKGIDDTTNLLRSFKKLHTDVVQFGQDFHIPRHTCKDLWMDLMYDIDETNESLEKEKMLAIDGTAKGLDPQFVTGGLIAIGALCPLLWLKCVVLLGQDAARADKHWQQYQRLSHRRNRQQAELKRYNERHETARSIRVTFAFASLQYEMGLVLEKFANLERIWQFICSDLDAIKHNLEPESSAKDNDHFQRRIQMVCPAYRILADALRIYETHVDD